MARTRSKQSTTNGSSSKYTTATTDDSSAVANPSKLPPPSTRPLKVFILPKSACASSRIVSLAHPRYGRPTRYLFCPETGIYEFKTISCPKSDPRSWLLEPKSSSGHLSISQNSDLQVATPIDPVFLLLPVLDTPSLEHSSRLFLSFQHHLDNLEESSAHMSIVLSSEKVHHMLQKGIRRVCNHMEAGDESMFLLDEKKLLEYLFQKASRLSQPTLPPSMEEKYVDSVLAAPTTSVPRYSIDDAEISEGHPTHPVEPSSEVIALQRRKVAFDLICSSYVPASLTKRLKILLSGADSPADFSPLTEYLANISKIKHEAATARAAIDSNRKRGIDDDEEVADRSEKRRKKEEEEKRKNAGESKGVRDLRKVNVTGMKKLSEFFKKK